MHERLIVLEASWDDEFHIKRSVRPFIEGWANQAAISFAYRSYNDRRDLRHWLECFYRDPTADTIYVAGHGLGTRLVGLGDRGINIAPLLSRVFRKAGRPKAVKPKGLLVGACECFGERVRSRILEETNDRLHWVGGYAVEIPWLESTLVDIAFLEYRFRGRMAPLNTIRGRRHGNVDQRHGGNLRTVAKWIREDFPWPPRGDSEWPHGRPADAPRRCRTRF